MPGKEMRGVRAWFESGWAVLVLCDAKMTVSEKI